MRAFPVSFHAVCCNRLPMDRIRTCSSCRPDRTLRQGFICLAGTLLLSLTLLGSASALEATGGIPLPQKSPSTDEPEKASLSVQTFLDRLMMAESGGRIDARNPRSTALGPFQFIESTFLEVTRRHLSDEITGLTDQEILAKRAEPNFARRAALAYTQDNASFLDDQGLDVTSVNLRLAFLIGPTGATRLLRADADTPVSVILSREVLTANPFMASMTAADLLRRAALDLSGNGRITGLRQRGETQYGFVIPCNLGLASCRRWVALRKKTYAKRQQAVSSASTDQGGEERP